LTFGTPPNRVCRSILVLLVKVLHPDEPRLLLRNGGEHEIVFRPDTGTEKGVCGGEH
jgi:hypothetical protein